jgi:hypothetical protein
MELIHASERVVVMIVVSMLNPGKCRDFYRCIVMTAALAKLKWAIIAVYGALRMVWLGGVRLAGTIWSESKRRTVGCGVCQSHSGF